MIITVYHYRTERYTYFARTPYCCSKVDTKTTVIRDIFRCDTHQLLAYADDVNILGGGIHTLKQNAEALVAATMEIGLEVSADKTK